jgi:hypothetical protein
VRLTLEGQLRGQIARAESGKRTTLIVGVIIIVIIFGYMFWLSSMIRPYAKSGVLADMVGSKANDYAQEQVPQIAQQLKAGAPEAVAALRKQAMEGVPKLREIAEAQTLVLTDKLTGWLETQVDGIVAEFIAQEKGTLTPLIEAAAAEGNNVELEKAFQVALEERIGPEMDKLFADFMQEMDMAQRMLAYYAQPDDKLTEAERVNKSAITAVLGFLNDAPSTMLVPPKK